MSYNDNDTGLLFIPMNMNGDNTKPEAENSDNAHEEGSSHDYDYKSDGQADEMEIEYDNDEELDESSIYSYEYDASYDEEGPAPMTKSVAAAAAAAATVTTILGEKRKVTANDDFVELSKILDELKDAFAEAGVGYMNGSFKVQKELDDLFLPPIKRLHGFIEHEYNGSEGLVMPILKISTGFNGMLSLLRKDSLEAWGKMISLHDAILDMVEVFSKSEQYSPIFLHSCIDGDAESNCKNFLKSLNDKAVNAGDVTPMCQRIISSYRKVNEAIKNGVSTGLILYDGPLDDHKSANWTGDPTIQPESKSSEAGGETIATKGININDLITSRSQRPPTAEWTQFIEHVPRCAAAEGIRESSIFYTSKASSLASFDPAVPKCLKRLFKELDGLKDALPAEPNCSIWLRFDEDTPQYIRALIAAPLPGPTPYSGGMFAFDIYVPNDYPMRNPKVQLLTTGGGSVRFGPNLYANGHVCLSLLGTWSGPQWNPKHSSLHQLLLSIQGLILGVEHPYYLEPGHGGWEGRVKEGDFQVSETAQGEKAAQKKKRVPLRVILYEDALRVGSVKFSMIQMLEWSLESTKNSNNTLEAFGLIIQAHFHENSHCVRAEVESWISEQALERKYKEALQKDTKGTDTLVIDELHGLLPKLEGLLSKVTMTQYIDSTLDSALKAPSNDAMMEVEENLKPAAQPPGVANESKPSANLNHPTASKMDMLGQKYQKIPAQENENDKVTDKVDEKAKRVEELQRGMQEAAQQNYFIRAGHLQAQIMVLTEDSTATALRNTNANSSNDGWNDEYDSWSDDEWGTGFALAPHAVSSATEIPITSTGDLKQPPELGFVKPFSGPPGTNNT